MHQNKLFFADDTVLCGGKEVDMTEYLETWRKVLEKKRMRVSRLKTQFTDFKFGRNEETDRPTAQTLGDELEKVTHFKYIGSVVEEQCGMEAETKQRECGVEKFEEMQWRVVRQEGASKV